MDTKSLVSEQINEQNSNVEPNEGQEQELEQGERKQEMEKINKESMAIYKWLKEEMPKKITTFNTWVRWLFFIDFFKNLENKITEDINDWESRVIVPPTYHNDDDEWMAGLESLKQQTNINTGEVENSTWSMEGFYQLPT